MTTNSIYQKNGSINLKIAQKSHLSLPNTKSNVKAMIVFARLLSHSDGSKTEFTHQSISKAFGHKDRQWSSNQCEDFGACGNDMLNFLIRETKLTESLLALIEEQILETPLLLISEQYDIFQKKHPEIKLCKATFRSYVGRISVRKLLKRIQSLLCQGEINGNSETYLIEVLKAFELTSEKRKEILMLFPNTEADTAIPATPFSSLASNSEVVSTTSSTKDAETVLSTSETSEEKEVIPINSHTSLDSKTQKYLLVTFLYASGLSYHVLGLLFGVCSSTIHNWVYSLCTEEIEGWIPGVISYWSGRISVDEKYIKINSVWYYVLSAVDAQTGFPLLICIHSSIDTISWNVFFARLKLLYGVPKEVISDGSTSLLAGMRLIFPNVRHQLCKFHKLKNLTKHIFQEVKDHSLLTRCLRLARNIFRNRSVSSRKAAAKRLQVIGGSVVSNYISKSILATWRKLTGSLTSNASERFNRKIEKCVSARYGIPTVQSALVLVRALWIKEVLIHGSKHLAATNPLQDVKMSKICQDHFQWDHIQHFLEGDGAMTCKIPT